MSIGQYTLENTAQCIEIPALIIKVSIPVSNIFGLGFGFNTGFFYFSCFVFDFVFGFGF